MTTDKAVTPVIGPSESPQQDEGGCEDVFGHRAVAAAGNIRDCDAELLHCGLIEPVDARAGHLDELDAGAFE